jgi:hypothetical protein
MQTPWGESLYITEYPRGIKFVSTASHGGFFVPGELLPEMPPLLRVMGESWNATINGDASTVDLSTVGRWYEEDFAGYGEASMVVISFPLMFEDVEIRKATECFRNWYWKLYEAMTGKTLNPGESLSKDRQHADDPDPRDYASGPSRDETHPGSEALAEANAELRRELG